MPEFTDNTVIPVKNLRSGFTTGTAMCAAVMAVLSQSKTVTLTLPNKRKISVPCAELHENKAVVVKDAGDDPDVTNGIRIHAEVSFPEQPSDVFDERDIIEQDPYSGMMVIIRAAGGIGLVTRPGLANPVGKWAVNPGPVHILMDNLKLFYADAPRVPQVIYIRVSAENGAEIAKKTLNPKLGVEGGISILGNSGIVVPYSNDAYMNTISAELKSARANGFRHAFAVTGAKTENAVHTIFPDAFPVIRIADFIGHTVRAAKEFGFNRLTVACMPGKLFKYAFGCENTHAARETLDLTRLRDMELVPPQGFQPELYHTVREFQSAVSPEFYRETLSALARSAYRQYCGKCSPCELVFLVLDHHGTPILTSDKNGVYFHE